jgi:hypothetical protein
VRSRLSRARAKLARFVEEDREPPATRGEMTGAAAIAALPVREGLT